MSIVSAIYVFVDYDHEDKFRQHIEQFTGTSQDGRIGLTEADQQRIGGYKMAECDLYWSAINHLDVEGLLAHLDTFKAGYDLAAAVVVHTGTPMCSFHFWTYPSGSVRHPDG